MQQRAESPTIASSRHTCWPSRKQRKRTADPFPLAGIHRHRPRDYLPARPSWICRLGFTPTSALSRLRDVLRNGILFTISGPRAQLFLNQHCRTGRRHRAGQLGLEGRARVVIDPSHGTQDNLCIRLAVRSSFAHIESSISPICAIVYFK